MFLIKQTFHLNIKTITKINKLLEIFFIFIKLFKN